jgi:hypothetical protein
MVISKKQLAELEAVAKPLVEWMLKNTHPHCTVIVDSQKVELVKGVASIPTTSIFKTHTGF